MRTHGLVETQFAPERRSLCVRRSLAVMCTHSVIPRTAKAAAFAARPGHSQGRAHEFCRRAPLHDNCAQANPAKVTSVGHWHLHKLPVDFCGVRSTALPTTLARDSTRHVGERGANWSLVPRPSSVTPRRAPPFFRPPTRLPGRQIGGSQAPEG
jgi:hypothetical protein